MGNGTKVALVALLILMVVVVARFVKDDAKPASGAPEAARTAAAKVPPDKAGASLAATGAPAAMGGSRAQTGSGTAGARLPSQAREASSPGSPANEGALRRLPATAGAGPATQAPPPRPIQTPLQGSDERTRALEPAAGSSTGGTFAPIAPPGAMPPTRSAGELALVTTQTPPLGTGEAAPGVPAERAGSAPAPRGEPPRSDTYLRELARAAEASSSSPAQLLHQNPPASGSAAAGSPQATTPGSSPRIPDGARAAVNTHLAPAVEEFSLQRPEARPPAAEPRRETAAPATSGEILATHVIQRGESYWSLAKRYYGQGSLHALIEQANPGVKFHAGNKVVIPKVAAAPSPVAAAPAPPARPERRTSANPGSASPAGAPERVERGAGGGYSWYIVKPGETLQGLARRFYGDPLKTSILEEANDELKYTVLRAGQRIKVPDR
jgi:LysM repeat protein